VTIVAYTVLTFVSHHPLRPEPSVASEATLGMLVSV
jgi:hypothetical protein